MSQTTGCERFEAQCARKARVPQSAEKLTIRNPRPIVTHVSHVAMVSRRARAGVRHGGARGPQVGVRLPAPPLLPSVCLSLFLSPCLLCAVYVCKGEDAMAKAAGRQREVLHSGGGELAMYSYRNQKRSKKLSKRDFWFARFVLTCITKEAVAR